MDWETGIDNIYTNMYKIDLKKERETARQLGEHVTAINQPINQSIRKGYSTHKAESNLKENTKNRTVFHKSSEVSVNLIRTRLVNKIRKDDKQQDLRERESKHHH